MRSKGRALMKGALPLQVIACTDDDQGEANE